MLQYLFFCCSTKDKDHSHTVTLEDMNPNNPLITKNTSNINCITQSQNNALFTEANNNIKIDEEKENNDNDEDINKNEENNEINEDNINIDNIIPQNYNDNKEMDDINNSPIFNNPIPKTQILTINNINNININIHGEDKLKN